MNRGLELVHKSMLAYGAACRPLCQKLKLTQTAFDILMFLANNPEYTTARDIVEVRKIKANLVSINVDKLVGEGYLRREADTDDRRKTHLLCTDKAGAVIEQGRTLQNRFMNSLLAHIDDAARKQLAESIHQMEQNLDHMLEEEH